MSFPFDPSPATLWTLTKEENVTACDIRFVPIGVEATITRNGKPLYSRTFPNGDDALEWAEEERVEMLRKGWTIPVVTSP